MTYKDYINTYDTMVSCGAYVNAALHSGNDMFGESYSSMRIRETNLCENLKNKLNLIAGQLEKELKSKHPDEVRIKKLNEISRNLRNTIEQQDKRLANVCTKTK